MSENCNPPACVTPQATLLFFPGTRGAAGPAGSPSTVPGPTGPTGPAGAVVVYTGPYDPTRVYFDTADRRDLVSYNGSFWLVSNPGKSNTATWDAPNVADWASFGAFNSVATALALMSDQEIAVGLTILAPGFLQSDNYNYPTAGWTLNASGGVNIFGATNLFSGQVSTDTPRFNVASPNRTMPTIGYANAAILAVADGDILVNPLFWPSVADVDWIDAMIFFGWLNSSNSYIENRFGNAVQKFQVSVQGIGRSEHAGDFLYIQLCYRTRANGGAWSAITLFDGVAYMQPLVGIDQSFQFIQSLSVNLTGNTDIQFSVALSKGVAGVASVSGGSITALAFN